MKTQTRQVKLIETVAQKLHQKTFDNSEKQKSSQSNLISIQQVRKLTSSHLGGRMKINSRDLSILQDQVDTLHNRQFATSAQSQRKDSFCASPYVSAQFLPNQKYSTKNKFMNSSTVGTSNKFLGNIDFKGLNQSNSTKIESLRSQEKSIQFQSKL